MACQVRGVSVMVAGSAGSTAHSRGSRRQNSIQARSGFASPVTAAAVVPVGNEARVCACAGFPPMRIATAMQLASAVLKLFFMLPPLIREGQHDAERFSPAQVDASNFID